MMTHKVSKKLKQSKSTIEFIFTKNLLFIRATTNYLRLYIRAPRTRSISFFENQQLQLTNTAYRYHSREQFTAGVLLEPGFVSVFVCFKVKRRGTAEHKAKGAKTSERGTSWSGHHEMMTSRIRIVYVDIRYRWAQHRYFILFFSHCAFHRDMTFLFL
ncbi:unnamed protein product [Amoebophrya sp. A120]|nr:unnamed protein product [Amoebophrya sp. A120]|eukprot:GSA120T00013744001.1